MDRKNENNFIRQLAVYAGVTILFCILAIGSKVISWGLGNAQQMFALVNIAMCAGFIIYLRSSDHKLDFSTKISDTAALYMVCLWISLIVISNFYRPDPDMTRDLSPIGWLLLETLLIAAADESVFRSFGDFCFPQKGIRDEAAMIICSSVYYLHSFTGGMKDGLNSLILAVGVSFLMTGLYLKYRKLGANILYHFLLIFFMRLTAINSTSDQPVLGNLSPFIFALGVVGMVWYGLKLISSFNKNGVRDDSGLTDRDDSIDLIGVFTESRDRYKDKIMNKAQPTIDKRTESYQKKLEAKAQKQASRKKDKEGKR